MLPHDLLSLMSDSVLFEAGQAAGWLSKAADAPSSVYGLKGRLHLSSSGWLLLSVPNALVRGLFDALDVPGAEMPPGRGTQTYNAHISVMHKDEVARIGADKISERGHFFSYQLGPLQEVNPAGWSEMSKVWFVRVSSPELKQLRVSYGLSPLLHDHEFHISVAVRRTGVLRDNGVAKAAEVDPEIVIDRPKGYTKTFNSAKGQIAVTYPVDYGYLKGLKNPQDGDDADVFVGTGGPHYGRYMKGNTTDGTWKPDEHKWYTGLSPDEHAAMFKFWHDQDPTLIRDHHSFADHAALLADVRSQVHSKEASDHVCGLLRIDNKSENCNAGQPGQYSQALAGLRQYIAIAEGDEKTGSVDGQRTQYHTDRLEAIWQDPRHLLQTGPATESGFVVTETEKTAAGIGQALGGLAKAVVPAAGRALGMATAQAPVVGRAIGATASTAGKAIGNTASTAGKAIGNTALTAGKAIGTNAALTSKLTGSVVRQLPIAAGNAGAAAWRTARFGAGVPAGQPFAPSVGAAVKNTARLVSNPRYPMLDRAPGLTASPRVLDRTRDTIATGMRVARMGTTGVGGAVALHTAFRGIPDDAAENLAAATGTRANIDAMKAEARWQAPGVYAELAKQQLGSVPARVRGVMGGIAGLGRSIADDSPLGQIPGKAMEGLGNAGQWAAQKLTPSADPVSRMAGDAARSLAWPMFRYNAYTAMQQQPLVANVMNAVNASTPLGLASALGGRGIADNQAAQIQAIIQQKARQYAVPIAGAAWRREAPGPMGAAFNAVRGAGTRPASVSQAVATLSNRAGVINDDTENRLYGAFDGFWRPELQRPPDTSPAAMRAYRNQLREWTQGRDKESAESTPACNCTYPNPGYRNGSGHHTDCPVHVAHQAAKGYRREGDAWVRGDTEKTAGIGQTLAGIVQTLANLDRRLVSRPVQRPGGNLPPNISLLSERIGPTKDYTRYVSPSIPDPHGYGSGSAARETTYIYVRNIGKDFIMRPGWQLAAGKNRNSIDALQAHAAANTDPRLMQLIAAKLNRVDSKKLLENAVTRGEIKDPYRGASLAAIERMQNISNRVTKRFNQQNPIHDREFSLGRAGVTAGLAGGTSATLAANYTMYVDRQAQEAATMPTILTQFNVPTVPAVPLPHAVPQAARAPVTVNSPPGTTPPIATPPIATPPVSIKPTAPTPPIATPPITPTPIATPPVSLKPTAPTQTTGSGINPYLLAGGIGVAGLGAYGLSRWLNRPKHDTDEADTKTAAMRPGVTLQPHQARVRDSTGSQILYHPLGSGKTLSAIGAAEHDGRPYTAIVPASLRSNFREEQAKFTDGTTPSEVLSYDAVARGRRPGPTTTLIVDEAHRLRTPGTAQSEAVKAIASRAKRTLLLTGSPIVNRPGDLGQLASLVGAAVPSDPQAFEHKYLQEPQPGNWYKLWMDHVDEPGVRNPDDLKARLAGKVDYVPPAEIAARRHDRSIQVPFSEEEQLTNDDLVRKLPRGLLSRLAQPSPLAGRDIASLQSFFSGARQVGLSSANVPGDPDPVRAYDSSSKLQAAYSHLKAKLDADPRNKALIFSNFVASGLAPYAAQLNRQHIPGAVFHGGLNDAERKQMVAQYNQGKLRALLLGPSGSEGLSFKGTNLVQILDPHWNSTRGAQSAGRALRFDSHTDLPDSLRDVDVERYESTPTDRGFFRRLLVGDPQPTADSVLNRMSTEKDKRIAPFLQLLRDVGRRGT